MPGRKKLSPRIVTTAISAAVVPSNTAGRWLGKMEMERVVPSAERSPGGPGATWRVTVTTTGVEVLELLDLAGVIVMVPLKGLETGSRVARAVGSTVTSIFLI